MWYQIKAYFIFLFKSSNQHGIHSPFVYQLITKCFYNKTHFNTYDTLKRIRESVFQNHNEIQVTDFGAGSRVFKSNKRKVSAIAKNAGIPYKRQKLLFRLVSYLNAEKILELGTSVGLASAAMSLHPSAKIDTVEGCPNTSAIANSIFKEHQLNNITLHTLKFEDFFSSEIISDTYDLIYVDGNHSKEHTINYFTTLLNKINNNSVIIFDDIHWSASMKEAWDEIHNHPTVTVSIDAFYWGLIFFRKEQQKEHFVIRL